MRHRSTSGSAADPNMISPPSPVRPTQNGLGPMLNSADRTGLSGCQFQISLGREPDVRDAPKQRDTITSAALMRDTSFQPSQHQSRAARPLSAGVEALRFRTIRCESRRWSARLESESGHGALHNPRWRKRITNRWLPRQSPTVAAKPRQLRKGENGRPFVPSVSLKGTSAVMSSCT